MPSPSVYLQRIVAVTEPHGGAEALRRRMRGELGVAARDQIDAAQAETTLLLDRLGRYMRGRPQAEQREVTERRMAFVMAAIDQRTRRMVVECDHAHAWWPESGVAHPTLTYDLSSGIFACQACTAAAARARVELRDRYPIDDGLCDLCDAKPADGEFWPVGVASGGLMILCSVCDECREYSL